MGQKVNPISLRLPLNKRWDSKGFFPGFNYTSLLHQDLQIQRYVHGVFFSFKILCNRCVIKRFGESLNLNIYFYLKATKKTSSNFIKILSLKTTKRKPNFYKKKKLSKDSTLLSLVNFLTKSLKKLTKLNVNLRLIPLYSSTSKKYKRSLSQLERTMRFLNSLYYLHLFDASFSTKNGMLFAQFLALNLHSHIRKIRFFLRFVDRLLNLFIKHHGLKGVKLSIKGKLNGARRARTIILQKGKMPLNTLSSGISFGFAKSMTIYGICGVKVWLYY